jgi:molybdopterin molybdotransferase
MAELSDDCFAHQAAASGPSHAKDPQGGPLLRLADALGSLQERVRPVAGIEQRALAESLGAVLAEDLVAPFDVPPTDNAAVDGYAVYFDDLLPGGETTLPVIGRAAAGHPYRGPVARAQALRIFTGATVPPGPDSVVMQEDCRLDGDRVTIAPGARRGANYRRAGEDLKQGEVALAAGRRLRPVDVGLAASLGATALKVRRPLRVALFSTGDELAEPGGTLPPAGRYDANRFALAALLARQGALVSDLGILGDRRDAIAAALGEAARGHDLLLTSGGVSVGEEDHVKAAVESQGRLHFWSLAIKPGRPVALGQVGRTAFVGLPGNPAAAVVTFVALVRPLLALLSGAAATAPFSYAVESGFAHRKKPGRQEWLRVTLEAAADGWRARRFPREGSGLLSSLVATDGFAILEEETTEVAPGDRLRFLPYSEVAA